MCVMTNCQLYVTYMTYMHPQHFVATEYLYLVDLSYAFFGVPV